MKNFILLLYLVVFSNNYGFANNNCFIAKENNELLRIEGDCNTRYTPESSFKIALSMIGFDSGIFYDENNPEWPCKEEYDCFLNVCKGPHTPRTWMRDSCLWYSRVLTAELGIEKFVDYIQKFNYGNKTVEGEDALSSCWITSGSLKISPVEQTEFLQRFINHELPINNKAYEMTKKILYIMELSASWKLYGKTGNGRQIDKNGSKIDFQHGWFVGFIEKDGRVITFASHIVDEKMCDTFASLRARNEALIKLWYLINELEK